nr:hypothetical protein GCM10020092_038010 [Actinoplanes digitatis]
MADIASFTVPGDDRFGALIFNTPTLPRIRSTEDSEWGQSTADRLVRQTLDAAPRILRPGGTAYVQALVEVPRRYSSAAAAVRDWAGGHDVTVTPIDAPQLSVTREQLRRRRLPGHSLLAYGARSGELLDALAARDVVAVEPVTIAARVRP